MRALSSACRQRRRPADTGRGPGRQRRSPSSPFLASHTKRHHTEMPARSESKGRRAQENAHRMYWCLWVPNVQMSTSESKSSRQRQSNAEKLDLGGV
jgi:hypothetical protein